MFIKAVLADAEAISKLVNSAYRGESRQMGWITEADLLDGLSPDSEEVEQLINSDHAIILLCLN